uniref:NADPH--hemoprotein reductase n=1 Tax=Albugo laibachii Nc14 TaxID=890382 RepID=F0VYX4_9STRA|nr:NADPHcytochrome P450 reductase putative [Albugo laibachii Nc14]|eukprot:CCA13989.1 NADPHcytochrome P450 reductase putative [Albugo laibachii Nc14]
MQWILRDMAINSYSIAGTVLAAIGGMFLCWKRSQMSSESEEMLRINKKMQQYKKSVQLREQSQSNLRNSSKIVPANSSVPSKQTSSPGRRVVVLFGSQTGTAEAFAATLHQEGSSKEIPILNYDLEEYDAKVCLAQEIFVILVVATYGEGNPTDNAVEFAEFIKQLQKVDHKPLKNVSYTVFGLGNRQYEHYNAMGRSIDKQMELAGARRLYRYGEGDDDQNIENDFEEWKKKLWSTLLGNPQVCKELGLSGHDTMEDANAKSAIVSCDYSITKCSQPSKIDQEKLSETHTNASPYAIKASNKYFFQSTSAKVIQKQELCASTANRSILHLEIDLKGTELAYQTADNLAILPENAWANVERLANRLKYDLDEWVIVKPNTRNGGSTCQDIPFPSPCQVATILTRYLDISNAPRKRALKKLAEFAQSQVENEKLVELASRNGKELYQKWILEEHRSFVDVLEAFPSIHIPLEALLDIVPFINPRFYTISSSRLAHPDRIHVTLSVLQTPQTDGRIFDGVCSSYLSQLTIPESRHDDKKKRQSRPGEQGSKQPRQWPHIRVFVRESKFRLPENSTTPIILIGPGTGIAPMRAFLHERLKQQELGYPIGHTELYFGCRNEREDFIYRTELESFRAKGILGEMHVAFSRQSTEKVYVQHLLAEQGAKVWTLLHDKGAYVYICGGIQMGQDVHKTLIEIIGRYGHKTPAEAKLMLSNWQTCNRLVQELWA